MVKFFCDKCGKECEPLKFAGFELCNTCYDGLESLACDYVRGNIEKPQIQAGQNDWHDIRLGYPSTTGVYLVAIRFDNGYTSSRLAKYNNGSYCWYKLGKGGGLLEDDGLEVVAWTEIPEPYDMQEG